VTCRGTSFAGKKYMGVERSTIVIDAGGPSRRSFTPRQADDHAAQILDALAQ
jgi:peroxiredoxin